jgi:hypothetical protein
MQIKGRKDAADIISVFRIYDIFVRIRGPVLWLTEPDPALFVSDFQDANKKYLKVPNKQNN